MKKQVRIFLKIKSLMVLLALSCSLYGQSFESLNKKAGLYLESQEYAMAIPVITEIIHLQPGNAVAYKNRGLCYLRTDRPEKAIQDYLKAYDKDPSDTTLLLVIGNLFERVNNTVSAGVYYSEYLKQKPEDPSGAFHLSLLLTGEGEYPDSAISYAEIACKNDPFDPSNWYALGMAHFAAVDYQSSIAAAKKGLALKQNYDLLHKLLGLNYYFLGGWDLSFESFATAYEYSNGDPDIAAYKANLLLICNSDSMHINAETGELKIENPATLPDQIQNVRYIEQLSHFNTELTEMGVEDFLAFYISYVKEGFYMPTSLVPDSLIELYQSKYYAAFQNGAEEFLTKDPTNFPLYRPLADVYFRNGEKEKAFESLFKYYGFLNAIKASGEGDGHESALLITNTGHEKEVAASMGLEINSQSLQMINGKYYDRLVLSSTEGEESIFWFNVDIPFQWQSRGKSQPEPAKKTKKGRRLKKS